MAQFNKNFKVSVLIPSYNHAQYVGHAIQSVLNQTYQDFEIIITDDGSCDNSLEVIESVVDPRIQLYKFERNRGPSYALLNCIQHAKGEYYALMSSDDMWDLNKLEKQVSFLDNNSEYGAVFSYAQVIDEDGNTVNPIEFPWTNVFTQKNRSRGKWLRRFFFELNCICHPSVLIRKQFYNDPKLHNAALRQLPDFNIWIETVKKTSIHILEEELVLFRWLSNAQNTSADTPVNKIRNINEVLLIMRHFFDNIPYDVFIDGFGDLLINPNSQDSNEIKCEQAFLYFKMFELRPIYQILGIEKLYDLLQQPETREILKNKYDFDEREFYKITGEVDILDNKKEGYLKKLQKFIKYHFDKS